MATQNIDLGNTSDVSFNGNQVDFLYLDSALIWTRASVTLYLEEVFGPVIRAESGNPRSGDILQYKVGSGNWSSGVDFSTSPKTLSLDLPEGSTTIHARIVNNGNQLATDSITVLVEEGIGLITESSAFVLTESNEYVDLDGNYQGNVVTGEIEYSNQWMDSDDVFDLASAKSSFLSNNTHGDKIDIDNLRIYRFDLSKLGISYYPGIPLQIDAGAGLYSSTPKVYQVPWAHRSERSMLYGSGSTDITTIRGVSALEQMLTSRLCPSGTRTDNTGYSLSRQSSQSWINDIFGDYPGASVGINFDNYFSATRHPTSTPIRCLSDSDEIKGAVVGTTYSQPAAGGWDGSMFCGVIKPVANTTYMTSGLGTPNSGTIHSFPSYRDSSYTLFGEKFQRAGREATGLNVLQTLVSGGNNNFYFVHPMQFLHQYFSEPMEHVWGHAFDASSADIIGRLQRWTPPGYSSAYNTYGIPQFAGKYLYITLPKNGTSNFIYTRPPRVRVTNEHLWGGHNSDFIWDYHSNTTSSDKTKIGNIPGVLINQELPAPVFPTHSIYFNKYSDYTSWSHTLFCPLYYLNNNADLLSQYGERNISAATQHFLNTGINESSRNGTYGPFEYNRGNSPYGTITLPGPTASNDDFTGLYVDTGTGGSTYQHDIILQDLMKMPGVNQTGPRGKEYHVIQGYNSSGAVVHKEILNI